MISQPDLWETSIKSLAMLSVVIGTIVVVLFFIKKFTLNRGHRYSGIKIISSCHIAPRKQILLIDVMNEKLVIGVTRDRINCLARIEKSSEFESLEQDIEEADENSFSNFFKRFNIKTSNQNDNGNKFK
ncbi:flagellar protein FliO/FliZ [Candidatus Magnetomoraceae bacterium gMMP-15]